MERNNTEPRHTLYELLETDEYERLVKFFVVNELEFDGDEEVDTDIVRCYKIENGSIFDDEDRLRDPQQGLIGGAVLAKREGRHICDGIAVNPFYRGEGIGELLIKRLIEDVKEFDGDGLYLVARAPEFFRKQGFDSINPDDAPNFFECKYCPQYQKNCHPEIMKYNI